VAAEPAQAVAPVTVTEEELTIIVWVLRELHVPAEAIRV
jgi:hypothetical protein